MTMKASYVFPAIVEWVPEDQVFDINFPDLEECFTFAESDEDVIRSAREVLELCLYDREERQESIPTPTGFRELNLNAGESVLMVDVWMVPVRDRFANKAVKKTLTIPKWLNDIAEENKVNFSQLLTSSLKEYLGVPKS
jgi:predicted RNase H-like HicB family nuclease